MDRPRGWGGAVFLPGLAPPEAAFALLRYWSEYCAAAPVIAARYLS